MGKMPGGAWNGRHIGVVSVANEEVGQFAFGSPELDLDEGENHDDLGTRRWWENESTDDEYGPVYGEDYEEAPAVGPLVGPHRRRMDTGASRPDVNRRKRHLDSPLDIDMEILARYNARNTSVRSEMSIRLNNSTNNTFKLSFSNSDSTPCPVQPRKKSKLKFKGSPVSSKRRHKPS